LEEPGCLKKQRIKGAGVDCEKQGKEEKNKKKFALKTY